MKNSILTVLIALMANGALAQTATIIGNTVNANNGPLVLKGEKADGTTTKYVQLDGNGFLTSTGGAKFKEDVSAQMFSSTSGTLKLRAQNAVETVEISNVGHVTARSMSLSGADGLSAKAINIAGKATLNGIANTGHLTNNGRLTNNGPTFTGTGGSSLALKASGYAEITQNLYVGGYTFTNQLVSTNGAIQFNGARISGINRGYAGNDAVNMNQFNEYKTQVTSDITTAKTDAMQSANNYTNTKFNELSTTVTAEVTRLDTRIDGTNAQVLNLTTTVENNKIEAKNYTDVKIAQAVSTTKVYTDTEVIKTKSEAKAYTDEETQRAIQAEKQLKDDISFYNDRALKAETKLREDLRTETDRALKAEQDLSYEISGVGATVMALGSLQSSSLYNPDKKGNMSFGVGKYRKSIAYAIGASYYTTPNSKISLNIAGSNNTKVGAGVGVSFGF